MSKLEPVDLGTHLVLEIHFSPESLRSVGQMHFRARAHVPRDMKGFSNG